MPLRCSLFKVLDFILLHFSFQAQTIANLICSSFLCRMRSQLAPHHRLCCIIFIFAHSLLFFILLPQSSFDFLQL
jgi:hypothetical protein